MGIWNQLAEYFYLRKHNPDDPPTKWMKYMHGMNRISIFIFTLAVLFMLFKFFIIPLFQ
ncbi:MAG: hypothetical protein JSS67_05960 [Bacteroidetes bacterium]|nr:hypothetical protein [Bacteroidota bacterium]